MSKLDELIQQLCPDGVEFKNIMELANVAIGEFVRKDKQNPNAIYPVYNGGCCNTGFYEQFNMKAPKVIMSARGAGAGFVNYIDRDFWAGNSCYSICPKTNSITIKYLYYYLKHNETAFLSNQQKGGIPAVSKKQVEDFSIPLPPLPVQEEIVRILDQLTETTQKYQAELEAELDARKKQYEEYRDQLLDLEGKEGVEMKTLGEVCIKISSGKNKSKSTEGLYPVFGSTGIIAYTDNYIYDKPLILVARVGANAGFVHISYGKYDVTDNTLIVNIKDCINQKYVYHILVRENLNQYAKGGGQPLITGSILKELVIPIPPKQEQSRIVSILDRMDKAHKELTQSIKDEIKMRQKQYEYYRNQLLTFDRKE